MVRRGRRAGPPEIEAIGRGTPRDPPSRPGYRANCQVIYRAVPYDCPPGVKTEEIKIHPVRLTLYSPGDVVYASMGVAELTRQRIVRLTYEAMDQGGLLTQADLAILLGEGPRTIGKRIKELQDEEDIIVPTRGKRMAIGPGTSHKTRIVELYIEGHDFTDIKRRTRHGSEYISRYLKGFARIMVLHERDHTPREIRVITDHSERLVKKYLEILEEHEMVGLVNARHRCSKGVARHPYRWNHIRCAIREHAC